jgi:hypothetical protein
MTGHQSGPEGHADGDLDYYLQRVRWVLHECGAGQAAALLEAGTAATALITAVVVGEPGVGKSSLVNALLGGTELLPTGSGGASGAYCLIQHGPALAARIHLPGGQAEIIEGEAARTRVLECGRADADPMPTWIEVQLPDARLDGVQLVDTPGVGGLAARLDELTLQSLERAEALIFVSSCNAPLSRSELDFLRRVSARVERVIFTLAKADGTGWRKIAQENAALLATEIPRFAGSPILPVSARLARDSQRAGTGELSQRLLADSGIPALWQEIRVLATRGAAIRQANQIRAAHSALQLAHDQLLRARSVTESATDAGTGIGQQQARLDQLSQLSENWYFTLSYLSGKLRRNADRYLHSRSDALRAAFEHALSDKHADPEAAVRKLIAGVAQTQQEVAELVRARLAEITTLISEDLALDPSLPGKLGELTGDSLDVPVTPPTAARRRQAGEAATQTQTSYMGIMMGHTALGIILGAAGAAAGVATGGVSWAVAAAFGVGWTLVNKKIRSSAISDAALLDWAAGALNNAVYGISTACEDRIDDAVHLLQTVMRTAIPQEMALLRQELKEAQDAAAASKAERDAKLELINGQIDKISLLSRQANDELARLALPPPLSSVPALKAPADQDSSPADRADRPAAATDRLAGELWERTRRTGGWPRIPGRRRPWRRLARNRCRSCRSSRVMPAGPALPAGPVTPRSWFRESKQLRSVRDCARKEWPPAGQSG